MASPETPWVVTGWGAGGTDAWGQAAAWLPQAQDSDQVSIHTAGGEAPSYRHSGSKTGLSETRGVRASKQGPREGGEGHGRV